MFVEIDPDPEYKFDEDFILVNSIYCDASDSDPQSFNSDSDISYNDMLIQQGYRSALFSLLNNNII